MRWLDNLRQSTELLDDPARCVHICDREGDIWELFCLAREFESLTERIPLPAPLARPAHVPSPDRHEGPFNLPPVPVPSRRHPMGADSQSFCSSSILKVSAHKHQMLLESGCRPARHAVATGERTIADPGSSGIADARKDPRRPTPHGCMPTNSVDCRSPRSCPGPCCQSLASVALSDGRCRRSADRSRRQRGAGAGRSANAPYSVVHPPCRRNVTLAPFGMRPRAF